MDAVKTAPAIASSAESSSPNPQSSPSPNGLVGCCETIGDVPQGDVTNPRLAAHVCRLHRKHRRYRNIAGLPTLDCDRDRLARDRQSIQRSRRPRANVSGVVPEAEKPLIFHVVRGDVVTAKLAGRSHPKLAARFHDADQLGHE